MKKIILGVVTAVMMFLLIPGVKAAEKVPVYMFTKNGCSACEYAEEYFAELKKDNPDLFELYNFEVFDSDENGNWIVVSEELQDLLVATLKETKQDTERIATPTIVIGDFITVGVQSTDDLYNAIIKMRDAEKPVNIVKNISDEKKLDLEALRKKDNSGSSEQDKKEEGGKYDALIVIGIFVVLIGGFAGLIFLGKKGN